MHSSGLRPLTRSLLNWTLAFETYLTLGLAGTVPVCLQLFSHGDSLLTSYHVSQVMATDGVWDTVSNADAVRDISRTARHVDFGAKSICMRAWSLGSDDNITAVCVYFNHQGIDYDERATTRMK